MKCIYLLSRLILAATVICTSAKSAIAQTLPPMSIQFAPGELVNPGRPGGRRRGGGSRGGCSADGVPLSAIAYSDSQPGTELGVPVANESVGAFTTQAQPTLWFYLPQALSSEVQAELVVKDEQDAVLYRGQLKGNMNNNGIISVPMAVDLAVGNAYHWFLSLDCGETDTDSVDGWIVRRENRPEVTRILTQAEPRNRAAIYASYGYLQDALSELATLRLRNLDDSAIAEDWVGFLSDLGLEDLIAAPILDCCQLAGINADTPAVEPVKPIEETIEEIESAPPNKPEERSVIERVPGSARSPRDR